MDQFYSVLSSWWKGDPYDVLTMNIISALPMEIAIVILRLLDPRSLCEAMLVNRSWLGLIRSDAVLRARVHAELTRQRREYWALIAGSRGAGRMPNAVLDAHYYRHLHQHRPQASTLKTTPKFEMQVFATALAANPSMQGAPRPLAPRRALDVAASAFQPLAMSTQVTHAQRQRSLKATKHRPSTRLRDKIINRKPSCLRI